MLHLMQLPITPPFLRIIDCAMAPLMFILGGFKRDSIQETHPWHTFRDFKADDIDKSLAVVCEGNENTSFNRRFLFLFHAPLFGGWKKYSVLAPTILTTPFYVGWLVYDVKTNSLLTKGINKLPIYNGSIRLLNGPTHYISYFFAMDANGHQVATKLIGRGKLGDSKYPQIRLF